MRCRRNRKPSKRLCRRCCQNSTNRLENLKKWRYKCSHHLQQYLKLLEETSQHHQPAELYQNQWTGLDFTLPGHKKSVPLVKQSHQVKEDVSFDHWIFQVQAAKKLYLEEALQQGIIQSLKRYVANTISYMGLTWGDAIIAKLQDKYAQVASSDVFGFKFLRCLKKKGRRYTYSHPEWKAVWIKYKWGFPTWLPRVIWTINWKIDSSTG